MAIPLRRRSLRQGPAAQTGLKSVWPRCLSGLISWVGRAQSRTRNSRTWMKSCLSCTHRITPALHKPPALGTPAPPSLWLSPRPPSWVFSTPGPASLCPPVTSPLPSSLYVLPLLKTPMRGSNFPLCPPSSECRSSLVSASWVTLEDSWRMSSHHHSCPEGLCLCCPPAPVTPPTDTQRA